MEEYAVPVIDEPSIQDLLYGTVRWWWSPQEGGIGAPIPRADCSEGKGVVTANRQAIGPPGGRILIQIPQSEGPTGTGGSDVPLP